MRLEINDRRVDAMLNDPNGMVAKELERRAARIEGRAKDLCPVDTGRLRSSIETVSGSDAHGLVVQIGTNVEYAIYVETGTRRQRAQPFLRPAFAAGRDT